MRSTKKISLSKFQEKSSQVLQLVNTQSMEVIIYDKKGPVARLAPYTNARKPGKLRTVEPQRESSESPMNRGGVWAINESASRKIMLPKPEKNSSLFSISGLWKAARVSAILPFMSRM